MGRVWEVSMMNGRRRNYDYNSKRRDWRQDRTRDRWKVLLMLLVGMGIIVYIVYLCFTK